MRRGAPVDPLPHLLAVAAAVARDGQPAVLFEALERGMGATIGHKLFTILRYHPGANESERIYSNQPVACPVGGRKPVRPTPSTVSVFGQREAYIGRTAADIRACFRDHDLIFSLGCEAVLNLPVVGGGRVLGTVNLLHEAGWYDERDVPLGLVFAGLAVPAYLAGGTPPGAAGS